MNRYTPFIRNQLSKKRLRHSIRTADLAVDLAKKYLPRQKERCRLAGFLHDAARGLSHDEQRELILTEGESISACEKRNPSLLHSHAGALLLQREFPELSPVVLSAVRYHTSGDPLMDDVAKIVYLADFFEPGRKHIDPLVRDQALSRSLDEAMLVVLEATFHFLLSERRMIALPSFLLYNELVQRRSNEK